MRILASRTRHRVRYAGVVTTGFYVALGLWLAAAALDPRLPDNPHPMLAALVEPGSAWAMTLVMALGITSCLLVLWSRQTDSLRAPLLGSIWAATTAIVLAMAAYLPCSGSAPAGWHALTSTVGLFVGAYDEPFGPGHACAHAVPLALHVARLAALTATLTSVLSVIAAMSRTQIDRLKLTYAKSLTAVIGIDEDTVAVVEALARQTSRQRAYRTVLLTSVPDRDCVRRASAAGALVAGVDLDNRDELTALRLWRKVDRAFLLSANIGANQQRAESLKTWLTGNAERQHTASGSRLPLVVRVDDPWLADEWRRRGIGDPHFAIDALAVYEETADALVVPVLTASPTIRHVLVAGAGPLALALLAELSQRGRERQFVGEGQPLPEITLIDVDAGQYLDDHGHRQRRFVFDPLVTHATDEFPTIEALTVEIDRLLTGGVPEDSLAVVVAMDGTRLGTRLATRHRTMLVLEPVAGTAAISTEPLFANLRPYSLTLSAADVKAEDCWERAAMAVHERYRRRYEGAPLAVPWDQLPREFYRQSNRRQIRTMLDSIRAIGRTWQTSGPEDRRCDDQAMADGSAKVRIAAGLDLFGLTEEDLEALATNEHQSWLRHYRADGWRHGPRDDAAKTHPSLLSWLDLADADRDKTRAGVIDCLFQLRALGYRSEEGKKD